MLSGRRRRQTLRKKLTHKLKEGWQPYGGPVAITPYTLMQAVAIEGEPQVGPSSEPDWYYVIVLAGQSNAMAYGEGLPLPDSYDAPDPRIKQLARRSTVTPGGAACRYNDIIPADHCLHDVQDMSTLNHPKADLSKGQYGCVGQGLHIAKKLLPYIPNNAGDPAGTMLSWWFGIYPGRGGDIQCGHGGPARIRRAGVWVNRYIRT